MKKSLKFNFLMNLLLSVSNFIFPLITFPYISRILLADGIGRYSFAQSIINYFVSFAMLGIPLYGVKMCAAVVHSRKKLVKIVRELLIINTFLGILSLFVLWVFILMNSKLYEFRNELAILSVLIPLNILGVEWYFKAKEDFLYITKRTLIMRGLGIILLILLVKASTDLLTYISIMVFTSSGAYVLNFIRLCKELPNIFSREVNCKQHIKPLLSYYIITMGWMMYSNTDIILLGYLSTNEQIGYYTASLRIKYIITMIIATFTQTILPRVIQYFNDSNFEQAKYLLRRASSVVFFLSFYFIGYIVTFSKELLLLFSGNAFLSASSTLQITICASLAVGLSGLLNNTMIAQSRESIVHRGIVGGIMINLAINVVTIPLIGSIGSGLATILGECATICILLFYIGSDSKEYFNIRNSIKLFLSMLIVIQVTVFFGKIISFNSTFLTVLTTGLVYSLLFFISNYIFKEEIMLLIWHGTKGYLKKLKRR